MLFCHVSLKCVHVMSADSMAWLLMMFPFVITGSARGVVCLLMHRMPSFVTAALLSGALWSTFAASDSVVDGSGRPDLRLLFVGNSLLYYNGGVYKVQLLPLAMHAFQMHPESNAR